MIVCFKSASFLQLSRNILMKKIKKYEKNWTFFMFETWIWKWKHKFSKNEMSQSVQHWYWVMELEVLQHRCLHPSRVLNGRPWMMTCLTYLLCFGTLVLKLNAPAGVDCGLKYDRSDVQLVSCELVRQQIESKLILVLDVESVAKQKHWYRPITKHY